MNLLRHDKWKLLELVRTPVRRKLDFQSISPKLNIETVSKHFLKSSLVQEGKLLIRGYRVTVLTCIGGTWLLHIYVQQTELLHAATEASVWSCSPPHPLDLLQYPETFQYGRCCPFTAAGWLSWPRVGQAHGKPGFVSQGARWAPMWVRRQDKVATRGTMSGSPSASPQSPRITYRVVSEREGAGVKISAKTKSVKADHGWWFSIKSSDICRWCSCF